MAAMGVAMTHDELLAKIDTLNYLGRVGYISSIWNALRAVVELHKPSILHSRYSDDLVCEKCQIIRYPCSTIQAIEKELK